MHNIGIPVGLIVLVGLLFPGNTWFWKADDPPRKKNKEKRYQVIRVYDGDTLQVGKDNQRIIIRMAGIDAPETGFEGRPGQPYSRKAKHYLEKWVKHEKILIKGYGKGGYGRQLAEVFVDSTNINLEMIRAGYAEVYSGKLPETLDSTLYYDAQTQARKKRKGMWRQGQAYKSPRIWRKLYPRK